MTSLFPADLYADAEALLAELQRHALLVATAESCTANGMDDFEKIRFWTTPVSNCSQGDGACVPYYRWVSDYIGVIGGR